MKREIIFVSVPFGVLSNINEIFKKYYNFMNEFPSPSGFYLISMVFIMIREEINGFPSPSGFYLISIECGCAQDGCLNVSVPFGVLSNINSFI